MPSTNIKGIPNTSKIEGIWTASMIMPTPNKNKLMNTPKRKNPIILF